MTSLQSSDSISITLPDLPLLWGVQWEENPLAEALILQADECVKSNEPFTDPRAISKFLKCKFGLFASLFYPKLQDAAHVRATIEQMHLYFVIDHLTDEEDAPTVRRKCDEVMYAFRCVYFVVPSYTMALKQKSYY